MSMEQRWRFVSNLAICRGHNDFPSSQRKMSEKSEKMGN